VVENLKTILVVDDCDLVLNVLVATLKNADFVVLQAHSGPKALKLAADHSNRIDLLLAAVEMPGMSGPFLGQELKKSRPDMRIMLTCGDILVCDFGCALIQKPFMPKKLIEMVNVVFHALKKSNTIRQFSARS
jgi:two-component system cell cycle sensor histidine kinase/response regulator CckA